MKLLIILTTLCMASSYGHLLRDGELAQDLKDFEKLIPFGSIKSVAIKYFLFDSEFRGLVNYLKGSEMRAAWTQVTEHEEVHKFVGYLESQGVEAVKMINDLADLLGFPHFPSQSAVHHRMGVETRSVKNFFKEVLGMIPFDKIEALFHEKLEKSPAFKELVEVVSAFNFEDMSSFVQHSKELTALIQKLTGYGLDLEGFLNKLKELFGW